MQEERVKKTSEDGRDKGKRRRRKGGRG